MADELPEADAVADTDELAVWEGLTELLLVLEELLVADGEDVADELVAGATPNLTAEIVLRADVVALLDPK